MRFLPPLMGDKKIFFGVIYVVVSIPLFAIINYITWKKGVITGISLFLLFYVAVYAPLFMYYLVAR